MAAVKNFYNTFINNEKLKHITRFASVGCLNTMFDFGIFSVLNSLFGVNYVISQIISYSCGTLNSFILNKFWTFNDTKTSKKTRKEFVQFIVVNSASLSASLIALSILMGDSSLNSFLAKIFSMVLAQVVNFLGYKFWVFGSIVKIIPHNKKLSRTSHNL